MHIEVRGLKELDETLVRVGGLAGTKVMRQALFAASKPILDRAKSNIAAWQGGSGALHLSMGRKFAISKGSAGGSVFTMQIGPRRRAPAAVALYNLFYKRKVKGIFYGHLLEFGHRIGHRRTGYLRKMTSQQRDRRRFNDGKVRVGGLSAGNVPAQRFLRPALDSGGLQAIFLLRQQLGKRLDRALKKQDPASDSV